MIEIAIAAMLAAVWLRPKWSILNKGGILLFLLAAPLAALLWWYEPERVRDVAFLWMVYLLIFVLIGSLLIVYRTRTDTALARVSGQPADEWFPVVTRRFKQFSNLLLVLILLGVVMGVAWILFSRSPLPTSALTALAISAGPIAPFVFLLLAVKAADLLTYNKPSRP